jgi:multidrug efflux pump subunit AcrB
MNNPHEYPTPRGAIAWMAENSVASNLLMIVLLLGGLMTVLRIKQEVFPDFDMDMVTVTVAYPGASPEEVEQGIILAVEEAVRGLDGVKEVSSVASEGVGVVTVELLEGQDNQKIAQDVEQEVNRITSFPEDAESPQVVLVTHRRRVLSLVLYGDQDRRVLHELAERTRDDLLLMDNITQVDVTGLPDLEISVEVPKEKLREYGLTLQDVAAKVRAASLDLPGGGIKTEGGEILLRMKEKRDYGRQFASIPIFSGNDGTEVLLSDIATVVDGFEDSDTFGTFNGKPGVLLEIYRVGNQTPIQVSDAAKQYMEEHRAQLPPGVEMAIQSDSSDVYRQRVDLLIRNGRIGLILVFLMLGLFLELRLAFWVTMGIPVSFLGTFLFLPAIGVTINMISLFAFLIALGIVVDDAIVVGENIYQRHQNGEPFLRASKTGAAEITMPVVFSILTNIVAFVPLLFMPGIMGKIFKNIPLVVITVFLMSLMESLFILPAHLGHHKDKKRTRLGEKIHAQQQRFSHWFLHMVRDYYGPFLARVLRNRYVTVSVGIMIMALAVGYVKSGRMGMTTFPKIESDRAEVNVTLPYGSAVEKTKAVCDRLVASAQLVVAENGGDQLCEGIFARIEANTCEVRVYLTDPEVRTKSTKEVVDLWRDKTGKIAGLEIISFASDAGGPGSGASLSLELAHKKIDVLESAAGELADALGQFPNVKDIDDGFSPGKRQYDFKLLPAGRSLGLTAESVARQVRSAFYGAEARRQQRGRSEVKVMVRLPKSQRVEEYDLEEMMILAPNGAEIPLSQAVSIERGRAYTSIKRREGKRTILVSADVDPRPKTDEVMAALEESSLPDIVARHPGLSYGSEGRQKDMEESIASLGSGFVIAMLAIYALLAVPFKSYVQPVIIMVSIPFGLVGAVLGHLLMGYSLSVMSLMGVVALSGVVVNDSLILIEFANREVENGANPHEAISLAGVRRFRPIMLTTITTFGGLAPMIFETSRQARFLIPMALSLGYGILFATAISLILVPCLYLIVEDIKNLFSKSLKQ